MKVASHIGVLLAVSTTLGLGLYGALFAGFDGLRDAEQASTSDSLEFTELESVEESLRVFSLVADLSLMHTHLAQQALAQSELIRERLDRMGEMPLAGQLSHDRALISESAATVSSMLESYAETKGGSEEEMERVEIEMDKELGLLRVRCDSFVANMKEGQFKNAQVADRRRSSLFLMGGLGFLLYACLVVLLWRWTAKTVIDPLKELTGEAEKAEDGDQEISPLSAGPYEVRVLGRAISGLVHSLSQHQDVLETTVKTRTQELVRANEDLLEEIVQRERAEEALKEHEEKKQEEQRKRREDHKMEALGRLAGGVAHDFNNLLTAIIGYSDLSINRMEENDPELESLKQIRLAGERASVLTRQLLLLGRKQILNQANLSLGVVASNMQKILQSMLGEKVALTLEVEPELPAVYADHGHLEQVLMNLTVIARESIEGYGTVKIKIGSGLREIDGVPQVHLFVEDDGVGMDAETQARMFEPYFSTKPVEKGTGLGLSIVYGIIQQNGGLIEVVTSPGKGTSMQLFFAATDELAVIPSLEESQQLQAADQKRILLVEDEDVVRGLVSSTLKFAGYLVTEASNGVEAVKIFEERPDEFDLVVTDVVMPLMGGRELVQAIVKLQPEMKALYLSGHIADEELQAEITKNELPFLPKPFKPSELIARVFEVINDS